MSQDADKSWNERRQELEASFFQERNRLTLERLRKQLSSPEQKAALAAASGISDNNVLEHLIEANINSETITALGLIPLVAVAWADGSLEDRERQAILDACEGEGITPDSVSYELLQRWLSAEPDVMLLAAWKHFIAAARKSLSPIALTALREDVLGRARNMAHTSGGLLGIGSISSDEQKTLEELEAAFHG